MPITDTDRLASPSDLRGALSRLVTIVRDIEVRPAAAQQRFWDDVNIPIEDLRIAADVSLLSATALYNILGAMCGPRLTELVNGQMKEYYEILAKQMQEVRPHEWEAFLDEQFALTCGTDHEGCLEVSVTLFSIGVLGSGTLKRVGGVSKLLVLTDTYSQGRYFASKDILSLEFTRP